MANFNRLIDRLSGSNAQLFRELQGRIKGLNLLAVVGTSLLMQCLFLFTFIVQIPSTPGPGESNGYQTYCVPVKTSGVLTSCKLNPSGYVLLDWPKWCGDLFQSMAWVLPLILIAGSTYLLASDLRREQQRGTLNFIRLSPQSASQFLWGKLLGVPVLVYGFVALALPLHVWAGATSTIGLGNTLLWELQVFSIAGIFLLLTAFFSMLVSVWPIAITGFNLWIGSLSLQITNSVSYFNLAGEVGGRNTGLTWFLLPLSSSTSIFLFGIGSCWLASYWLWKPIVRRYLNPQGTLLAKTDSYRLNLCFQIWMVGFVLPIAVSYRFSLPIVLICVVFAHLIAVLLALLLLIPGRQTVQDWSRYRRERSGQRMVWGTPDLYRDLLTDDRSPAAVAIAINFAIAALVWMPFTWLSFNTWQDSTKAILALLTALLFMFNYGTLLQLGTTRSKKEWAWPQITLLLGTFIGAPLLAAGVASSVGLSALSGFLLVIFSPLALFNPPFFPAAALGVGFAAQSLLTLWLIHRLSRQVSMMGRSATAPALA
jgi:hypothetical protein